jgi:hypothetical protein
MKKILILMLLAFSVEVNAKNEEPKLLLEYNYGCTCDTSRVLNMKADPNFCCYFDIECKANNSSEDICYIRDRETGILLGTIYGKPTKEFLLYIYNNQLQYIYQTDQIAKLVAMERQAKKD